MYIRKIQYNNYDWQNKIKLGLLPLKIYTVLKQHSIHNQIQYNNRTTTTSTKAQKPNRNMNNRSGLITS